MGIGIGPVVGMLLLAVAGLLVGWWLGKAYVGAALAASQQRANDLETRSTQQQGEIQGLRAERDSIKDEKTRSEEQLKAAQKALTSLTGMKEEMKNEFKLLAGDVLKESNKEFLGIANRELSAKEESIKNLLTPVRETLDKVEKQTQELETERAKAYTEVLTEIRNVQRTHETLRTETTQLVQALRAPKVRGIWGEQQLKRCIEFAGMLEHCSYDTEVFMRTGEDVAQRPDAVIHLPNGRAIIIDAKTPLDAYLNAMNATADEPERLRLLQAHALQVRSHLKQLSSKQYWQTFANSPDFVVCFLPIESLFSAALEQDPDLIGFASRGDVILATPTTLIALLKAIAYGWQQAEITRNAIEICKAGEELYRKLAGTQVYFTKLGNALSKSVEYFNNVVAAVAGKDSVFDKASKLHKLGIGQEEIAEIKQIEATARVIRSNHWDESIALAAAEEASKT